MTSALEGIKDGDTVEVTFLASVIRVYGDDLVVRVHDTALPFPLGESVVASPSFSIKKVEPPLQPGDKVQTLLGANVVVLAVDSGEAWVRFEGGATEVLPTTYLVRA